jgi:hypothetical protein
MRLEEPFEACKERVSFGADRSLRQRLHKACFSPFLMLFPSRTNLLPNAPAWRKALAK